MFYTYIQSSQNKKLGNIPAVYAARVTCPPFCPLKGRGCYGESGPVSIHWRNVKTPFEAILRQIRGIRFKVNKLWRWAVVGDLPGVGSAIDKTQLRELAKANDSAKGFTYTHKPLTEENRKIINEINSETNFTINLSADSLKDAEIKKALNVGPVVLTVPSTQLEDFQTKSGLRVKICPAAAKSPKLVWPEDPVIKLAYKDSISCETCGICHKKNRDFVIGFPAHGNRKRLIDERLENRKRDIDGSPRLPIPDLVCGNGAC